MSVLDSIFHCFSSGGAATLPNTVCMGEMYGRKWKLSNIWDILIVLNFVEEDGTVPYDALY